MLFSNVHEEVAPVESSIPGADRDRDTKPDTFQSTTTSDLSTVTNQQNSDNNKVV